jgi:RHS repeat-associated protein
VYGKIQEINKSATTLAPATKIQYTYDALGNRISQVVTTSDTKSYTWYVRDAQGNLLSTYTANGDATDLADLEVNQSERFLYGSSRLGVLTASNSVDGGPDDMQYRQAANFGRGYKQYELTNHLGNVLVTISDRKFAVSSTSNSSLIDHYEPHILTAQDYYPFGMISRAALPNNGQTYRFGFNGKLNDNDVKGLGNQLDFGERIYDPRTGRFLSVDALARDFPWNSTYAFAENKPTWGTDLDGAELLLGTGGTWLGATTFSNSSTIATTALAAEEASLSSTSASTALSSFRVTPGGGGNWASIGQSSPWTSWSGPWLMPYQPQLKNPNINESPQQAPQQAPQKNPQPQSNPQRQFDPYQKPEKEDDGNDGVYVYETGSSRKINAQIVDKSAQELPYFGITQNAVVASSGVSGRYSPNSPRALNLPKYKGIIGKTDGVTALGIESALIALNTYGKNFEKIVMKNIHSSADVQKSTRIDNFKFSLKDRDVMKLGVKWLEKHYGRNWKSQFLHSENKKGRKNN